MTQSFEIHAEQREQLGTGASRRLRRLEDKIPAIIYGAHEEPEAIIIDHKKMQHALEHEAFYSHILTIDIKGKKQKAVLRAVHRHPAKKRLMHMDFQRISAKEKLTMHVPLHFTNADDAPGVKEGGVVSHIETNVEVSCLPNDLPEFLEVDIANLEIDQSIHLSEISLPKDIELVALMHENDLPIVSIHHPRIEAVEEEVEEEAAEVEAAAAEGEAKEETKEAEAKGEIKEAKDKEDKSK